MGKRPKWGPGHPEWERTVDYLGDLTKVMNLSRLWVIRLSSDHPENRHLMAEVSPNPGQHDALIRLHRKWKKPGQFTDEERRNTLVHELLHLVLRDQREIVRTIPHEVLTGKRSAAVLYLAYKAADELATQDITEILAPFLPPYPAARYDP